MEAAIDGLVQQFEAGTLSRRQLVRRIGALAALVTPVGSTLATPGGPGAAPAGGRGSGQEGASTFQAVGLNHIALSVTDIPRSRDFYVRHLGLTVSRESASSCFLDCGDDFVALFRSGQPGLNHYCYAVEDYDVDEAAETLRANDLPPRVSGNRVYFDDPDGIEVQLSAPDHGV